MSQRFILDIDAGTAYLEIVVDGAALSIISYAGGRIMLPASQPTALPLIGVTHTVATLRKWTAIVADIISPPTTPLEVCDVRETHSGAGALGLDLSAGKPPNALMRKFAFERNTGVVTTKGAPAANIAWSDYLNALSHLEVFLRSAERIARGG